MARNVKEHRAMCNTYAKLISAENCNSLNSTILRNFNYQSIGPTATGVTPPNLLEKVNNDAPPKHKSGCNRQATIEYKVNKKPRDGQVISN
jgi:hypothetical protein